MKDFDLSKVDLDSLTYDERLRVWELLKELKNRQRLYPILSFKPQPFQQKIIDALQEKNPDWTWKYKFIIFVGWNWWWKTCLFSYITICISLWKDLCKKYWLPYLWDASLVDIFTSTWKQITKNIEPYLLWTNSDRDIIKFPWYNWKRNTWEVVKGVKADHDILTRIELYNWTRISFWTYDQWQSRLQGSSPDLTWMDEVPQRWSDFREIIRGTRRPNSRFIMSFTPTNYNKKIYDWIYWGQDNKFVIKVDSLENKLWDHSWMDWLSQKELKIVRHWEFMPTTWLVYDNFLESNNVIEHINPKTLWGKTRFYWALDFWVNHPMVFLFIAIDEDWHIYVFDEIHRSDIYLSDLVELVNEKKNEYWIELEYIVADSAWKRERKELAKLWLHTRKAKKKAREWNMSNVRGGIFKINHLLWKWMLIISDKCVKTIDEFRTYHYAENWADWAVAKENDDAMDALRYFIFSYLDISELRKIWMEKKANERRLKKIKWI